MILQYYRSFNNTKSVRIPNTGQIVQTERNDFKFGTGDFTIEMRLRADAISGNQIIFDMRRPQTTSTGLSLVLNGSGQLVLLMVAALLLHLQILLLHLDGITLLLLESLL
ncbi:MAG: hypothetical protein CM15mV6_2760 [uncultured marine virus]|nr:MAG: hypothetical protein CM15mV6_2760 [uncultured marine virus]